MKNGKVLSIILALALAVSGCAGGSAAGSAAGSTEAATAPGSETSSQGDHTEGGSQMGTEPGDIEPGEYARAIARRSQSSEDSDPTISKVAPEGTAGTGGAEQNGGTEQTGGAEQNGGTEQTGGAERNGEAAQNEGADRKACTVMIYMVGSNLESKLGNATKDLEEIDGAGLNFDNYNVIAYTGGSTRWVGDVPCDRNCVLDMSLKGEERIVAQTKGNANMGLPETLSAFLNYCGENYPADHNVLILWDHGGGPLWGYGEDELYDSDSLLLNEMRTAMDGSVFKGGADGRKLDLVGFDACLMGSLECMSIWQDYADYYVGSEELEPGDGWNYEFLKVLEEAGTFSDGGNAVKDGENSDGGNAVKDGENSDGGNAAKDGENSDGGHFARAVGESILASFRDYYEGKRSDTYNPDLTLSCIDLGKIDALGVALDVLAEEMADGVESGGYARLMQDRSGIKSFGVTGDSKGEDAFYYDLVDVGNLADHMEAFYTEEAKAVKEALRAAVVGEYANVDDAAGMTLYYPYKNKGQFEQLNVYYETLIKTKGYSRFLKAAADQFLKSKSRDWVLGKPKDRGDEYTLQLTHEQLANMTEATYTILIRDSLFSGYTPYMENCKIEPDKNGVLHLTKDPLLMVLESGEDKAVIRAVELESDRKRTIYNTKGMCLRSDLLCDWRIMDLESMDVTIRLSMDKKSGKTEIRSIGTTDDSSAINGGKNSVDLLEWKGIEVLSGRENYVPTRDETGRIRPFSEWITTDERLASLYSAGSGIRFDMVNASELVLAQDTICQIEIRDSNGEKYASEPVPITNDAYYTREIAAGDGKMTFAVYEDHAELLNYIGREARLEVPEQVDGREVTSVAGGAFSWDILFDEKGYDPVVEVVLPDTVTKLGACAFMKCRDLEKITIPAELKQIGDCAFTGCRMLGTVELPDSVESIGEGAFAYCSSLTAFRLPKSLAALGEGAFAGCASLERFTGGPEDGMSGGGPEDGMSGGGQEDGSTPVLAEDGAVYTADGSKLLAYPAMAGGRFAVREGTEEIAYGAFDGASLEEVILPQGLVTIADYAFYDCVSLQAPVLPEGLVKIGGHAFDVNWLSLKQAQTPEEQEVIYIPASLENVGEHAFDRFMHVRFEVSGENRHYSAEDGALTNKAGDTVICIATDPYFSAVFPEGTVEFSKKPLSAYNSLNVIEPGEKKVVRQIYLPASMTKFPEELPDHENEGSGAVYHCPAGSKAEKFVLRERLQLTNEMGRAEGTAEVPTQEGTLSFGIYSDHAVLWHYQGEDEVVEIPSEVEGKTVTEIGNGMEEISVDDNFLMETQSEHPNLKKLVIPEGVTAINASALNITDGSYLSRIELILPSTIRRLGRNALSADMAFDTFPQDLEILEAGCIEDSSADRLVVTPGMRYIDAKSAYRVHFFEQEGENNNYSVRDGVLFNADGTVLIKYPSGSSAEEYAVPEGTAAVGENAFTGCRNLSKISLPNSLKVIGDNGFSYCRGLLEVSFAENTELTAIGKNAFTGCNFLKEITLPAVEEIREYAFYGCESLRKVHFARKTRIIGDSVFYDTAITDPDLPDGLIKLGNSVYDNFHSEEGKVRPGSIGVIRIPPNLSRIGLWAFGGIGSTAFEVDPENVSFSAKDGLLMDKGGNVVYLCAAGREGVVTVPDGVTAIKGEAFRNAYGVTDIFIPDSVIYISLGDETEERVTVHCGKGSYAERYAISRGIKYTND